MYRLLVSLSLLLSVVSIIGSRTVQADTWPMYGRDPGHSFSTMDPLPPSVTLGWQVDLPEGYHGRGFALAENVLSVSAGQTASPLSAGPIALLLYDPVTGERKRLLPLGDGWAGTPAIAQGNDYLAVYRTTTAGTLYAYSIQTGDLAWSAPIEAGTVPVDPKQIPSVTYYDGKLWLPGANGKLLSWAAETGQAQPSIPTGLAPPAGESLYLHTLSVSDSGTFAASYRNWVYGEPVGFPIWRSDFKGTYTHPPMVVGPNLYLIGQGITGGPDAGVGMINLEEGRLRWFAPSAEVAALAADESAVFAAQSDRYLTSYTPFRGATSWSKEMDHAPLALIHAGGRLVIGDVKGRLSLRDASSGELLSTFPTQRPAATDLSSMHLLVAGGPDATADMGAMLFALSENRLMGFLGGGYGDIDGDGDVTVGDVVRVLRAIVGLAELTPAQFIAADVAPTPGAGSRPVGDDHLDISDALSILRHVAGLQPPTWPFAY